MNVAITRFPDGDVRIQADGVTLVKLHRVPRSETGPRFADFHDAIGNPTAAKQVWAMPADLDREVELPPMKAGGQFKHEAHMTAENKARGKDDEESGDADAAGKSARKAAEGLKVSKLVEKAATKK